MPVQEKRPAVDVDYLPLIKKAVPDTIVERIQALIATRKLMPGQQLPSERELATLLNVSRSAVREAIKILISIGILHTAHGRGTFVKEPQLQALTDLSLVEDDEKKELMLRAIEARALVDVEVARLAARHASEEDIGELEDYLAMSMVEPMKSKRKFGHDLGFEKIIAKAARNPYLVELQKQAHRMFEETWTSGGFIPRPSDARNAQHRDIVEAIKARDEARVVRLMKLHIRLED